MKSILLTRSIEDNYDIIRTIENNNRALEQKFKYICSPLVQYKDLNFDPRILFNYTNIIITSKFAAKLFVSLISRYPGFKKDNINQNFWVVGNISNIILTQNNLIVSGVARNIQQLIKNFPPEFYKQTIYLSSNEITQELPSSITRQIIYEVQYISQLHNIEEIKKGVDYILLYSQNSAKTLIKLLADNKLLELLSNSQVIAISKKVADIIKIFSKNVIYCEDGKPEQMLTIFKSY